MVTFLDWMKDKGYIQANVFTGIKRKPRRLMAKKRRMLTDEELGTLFTWLQENNPEYLAVCLLCYCCFMRPKEIALLRCGDIDIRKQLVHVRAEIAKNDKESFRTIPDAMMPAIRRLDLSKKDWFLFGDHPGVRSDFRPSRVAGAKKRFSDYWAGTVRDACGFGLEVQFYSQKDTGITNMLGEGVAINLVQQQADHSSVAMTALYVGHKSTASEELKSSLKINP
jgi:integrase